MRPSASVASLASSPPSSASAPSCPPPLPASEGAMHTEEFCKSLDALDLETAIRAVHQALLQLTALDNNVDCDCYDNAPAIAALEACMKTAGHIGF